MRNVLITGGAGFIGSNFVQYLLNKEHVVQIVNLDLLTYAGTLENLRDILSDPRHIFIQGDINDENLVRQIFNEHQIDTVVHFAAESHVDRSILTPRIFIQTNVLGTLNLLEVAREYWADHSVLNTDRVRFHHISTDEVFGSLSPEDPACTEATSYAPSSPYAASKASSDHLVRAYGNTYHIPFTITNCSNNYGPRQFPEKLIPLMILNAMEGKSLPVYGDGMQIRDWLHVQDHCEAIHIVLKNGSPGFTYNIGGQNQPSNISIVQTICQILDEYLPESKYMPHASLIQHVKDRPGHDRRYDMDIHKINTELGWKPRLTLALGLRNTVNWYLSHLEWVSAIREKQEYKAWMHVNYQSR